MANILILIGDKPESESEGYRIFEKLQEFGHDKYTVARYRDLEFMISPGKVDIHFNDLQLSDFDLVYIRDFHGYEPERNVVADYCKKNSTAFINTDTAASQKISKLAQYVAFSFAGVPFPRSVYAHASKLDTIADASLEYPIIVKAILANSGNDNFLITSYDELKALLSDKPDTKFIAQEAIENDGDYRIVVLGNEVGAVYRRIAKEGDHRNNIGKGGTGQHILLDTAPQDMVTVAIKAAQAVGREVCGVDVMYDNRDDRIVVLEANFNFGVKAAPEEVFSAMATYFHEKARQSKAIET